MARALRGTQIQMIKMHVRRWRVCHPPKNTNEIYFTFSPLLPIWLSLNKMADNGHCPFSHDVRKYVKNLKLGQYPDKLLTS